MPDVRTDDGWFTLEIDVHLCFNPPMSENSPGIVLTNSVRLPFVPTKGLIVTGAMFNDRPDTMGVYLKDLTWDVDRRVFMAYTEQSYGCFPILYVAQEIRFWLDRGWRFGSYADVYEKKRGRKPYRAPPICGEEPALDEEEAERLHGMKPRQRPPYFNMLLKALVREMAVLDNNRSIAYAMDKTNMFFEKPEAKEPETPAMKKFFAAVEEFEKLTFDQQYEWRDRVARRHPRLDQFVRPSRRRRTRGS
ncbi:MAG: hypothetical protein J0M17_10760 [Planctomycetes bacterium]|nr:hypothetical protein [Planctomycetota bacterium]